ncbi:related to NADH-ubiquinone oxidoreductase MLRQ subunit [Melanopsichium pennsylvanicum]|uniref:Related to NADH-ubiquinone oxidoreductase MLRQ subunit n=1 Tax=Melanopsichium pennsylvanicum TaxID=63383 RepID=A0AAJ5C5A5_9BASI|nr:related to NADH-ubiquinone oxidoreductase MLRQ subunit [Melanopsichium pennsylvanicum]
MAGPAAQAAKNKARQIFMKNWYAPEVLPIYVITGLAAGGATWYLTRLARGPDVIWDRKNNPTPWNNVEPGTNTKMMSVNQQFDKQYKRDRL